MKKAFKWLEGNEISYEFHDYKKLGVDEDVLSKAIVTHGWEKVINKRGTTWRKLPEDIKSNMDAQSAIEQAKENPSLIKRPLLVQGKNSLLGFDEISYKETLA